MKSKEQIEAEIKQYQEWVNIFSTNPYKTDERICLSEKIRLLEWVLKDD